MNRFSIRREFSAFVAFVLIFVSPNLRAEQRFIIAVGHNRGLDGEEALRYAEEDARRICEIMSSLGGVDRANAELLLSPTSGEVEAAIDQLAQKLKTKAERKEPVVLFFYYAGHGDRNSLHLGTQKLSRKDLKNKLSAIEANIKIAIFDTCQTTEKFRIMGVKATPGFDVSIVQPETPRGIVVLQSTREGEPAHESDRLGGAVFTHHLLAALRGIADADSDGRVTLMEAYGFAYNHTVQTSALGSNSIQHPSFDLDLKGSEQLVLTSPVKAKALLVLKSDKASHYTIFSQPTGTLVAEILAAEKRIVSLAVPEGRLLIQKRTGSRLEITEVTIPFGGEYEISSADFQPAKLELMSRRGGTLNLHPNRLYAGYSILADNAVGIWLARRGIGLAYAHDWNSLSLNIGLHACWTEYAESLFESKEMIADISAALAHSFPVLISFLDIGIGPVIQYYRQDRKRMDADRIEEINLDKTFDEGNNAIGAGGMAEVRWRFPLANRLELTVGVSFTLLAHSIASNQGERWRAIPQFGGFGGLGYRI